MSCIHCNAEADAPHALTCSTRGHWAHIQDRQVFVAAKDITQESITVFYNDAEFWLHILTSNVDEGGNVLSSHVSADKYTDARVAYWRNRATTEPNVYMFHCRRVS